MAEIVNTTSNVTSSTSQNQAAQQAAQTTVEQASGLDKLIIFLLNIPIELVFVVVAAAAAGIGIYFYREYFDSPEKLDKTTLKERIQNTFLLPTAKHGTSKMEWVWNASTENTKSLIGLSVTQISTEDKVILDPDFEDGEHETEDYKTVQHMILPGSKKFKAVLKWPIWRLSKLFSETGLLVEFYDLPKEKLNTSDQGVIMDPSFYPVKKNGLWRDHTMAGHDKVLQRTFADAHFDWAESMQQLPEIYSQLNSRVAGQLNIMDRKSKNIRKYEEMKQNQDLDDAIS